MTDTPPVAPDTEGVFDDVVEQKAVRLAKRERLLAERADAAGGARGRARARRLIADRAR